MPRESHEPREIVEREKRRHLPGWGRSPRPLVVVGLILVGLAASLGVVWLREGLASAADLKGPHQQWHGVVVEHQLGTLLFTSIELRHSLVVGFIDRQNPTATFTVNVDAETFAAVPDGKLITLDLAPQTGHVYRLATSADGTTWREQPLDPNGSQLRLICWLLLSFGGALLVLGVIGLVGLLIGLVDLLAGTAPIGGQVVDVLEGGFIRLPRVVLDRGSGPLVLLALRPSIYEKVCEDGGQSRMIFFVSRVLKHVRRGRRQRTSSSSIQPETERRANSRWTGEPSAW